MEKAIEAYNQAVEIDPHLADTYNNLGNAYQKQGELAKAIEAYNQAIEINPHYAAAYNNLGLIHKKRQKFEEAISYWEKSLDLNKEAPQPWRNIAQSYSAQNRVEEALDLLEEAYQYLPSSLLIYLTLGGICYNESIRALSPLASQEKQRQWLGRALDAFDSALKLTDDTSFLGYIAILWIRGNLRQDGLNSTIKQITQQLVPRFSQHPGHLLFASLVGLLVHFVEILRDMCLRDMEDARHYWQSFLYTLESPEVDTNADLKQHAIAGLKQLSEKYNQLDSNDTFLIENQYQDLMCFEWKEEKPQALKNLLDEVGILVEEWVEEIANLRFLVPTLDSDLLVRLYQKRMDAFEQELKVVGGLSEDMLKVVYGHALLTVYHECLYKQEDPRKVRGQLTFLRHALVGVYRDLSQQIADFPASDCHWLDER